MLKRLYFHRFKTSLLMKRTVTPSTSNGIPHNKRNLIAALWKGGCVQGMTEQPRIQHPLKAMGISLPSPPISRSHFPWEKGSGGCHFSKGCILAWGRRVCPPSMLAGPYPSAYTNPVPTEPAAIKARGRWSTNMPLKANHPFETSDTQ